uniref:RNA-directed DNA polymerase, eukaryota n=1 Tax=Tanacetum cinerariifolium TaxID=118510 RepID=A0A6L2MZM4_TANCI|nr:hypothetical protein [Tanacetum cinerariifolium]
MDAKDSLQKSKIKWAIEGDENSSFFHGIINKKCSHLSIRGVFVDGLWVTNLDNVKDAFLKHFEDRFRKPEIRMAVWSCGENKSPGPDGFTFEFFQKYWSLIGLDLCAAVEHFFVNGSFPMGCDASFIALIPKVMDTKHILDGPFILNEVLNWCKRKKKQAMFFKCKWVRGTFTSAMASVLINGSPSSEFQFHAGLKQGDPLSPYIFILNMESLHISFSRAVNEGLFKGQFRYLGVMVGESMSRHMSWVDTIAKLRSRLSNWKVKTLSIGGRLTLLKSVLGASPIYNMSLYKAPSGVLKSMEAIRSRFFNGADSSKKKITWVAWDKVLASKNNGGLGVSSFYALNRALLLKWVRRFVSQGGSLWCRVIQVIYGSSIDLHPNNLASNWCLIVRELNLIKDNGFDFISHCKKRIRDGSRTSFWHDSWTSDMPFRDRFPRLFALELDKNISVAAKLGGSVVVSFRRNVRDDLFEILEAVSLSSDQDSWICDLSEDVEFHVKEVRNILDELILPSHLEPTRWVKYVPIKINVFAWSARRDCLPTRSTLIHRGVVLDFAVCLYVKSMRRTLITFYSNSGLRGFLISVFMPKLKLCSKEYSM